MLLTITTIPILAFLLNLRYTSAELALNACNITKSDRLLLAQNVKSMFTHAYTAYKSHAHPSDELRPLSCTSSNSFAALSVTLIDTLDTFILLNQTTFLRDALTHISTHTTFEIDDEVSLFETTIRVLGGLLSTHTLLTEPDPATKINPALWLPVHNNTLLTLATDLADRLLPAFDTPTGIPFGSINLIRGVHPNESRVASTAGAGSLLLEFGTLSRLRNDPKYYRAAFRAMAAIHDLASPTTGLVGNHIDIFSGNWVATESGVGGLVDSFYEYMYKGYVLFGDERLLRMFRQSNAAVQAYVHKTPWYLDADMWSGQTVSLGQSSLAAFWPGLQVLTGEVEDAIETTRAHYAVWRRYGCLPEGYDVVGDRPVAGQVNYPLRPELAESVFYLHWATNDSSWLGVARAMMFSLEELTKVPCGYAAIQDVGTQQQEDIMPSFVLSETFKYLYLVFADGEDGEPHWARSGRYVFTTEAHPLRIVAGDMRELLGDDFEDRGVEDGGTGWRKCTRRKDMEDRTPCGYGMGGTDFPKHSLEMEQETGVSESITQQLRERARRKSGGEIGVGAGDMLFGEGWGCRIVKVEGQMVSFEELDKVEADLERERFERVGECRRMSAVEDLLGLGRGHKIG